MMVGENGLELNLSAGVRMRGGILGVIKMAERKKSKSKNWVQEY